MKREAHWLGHYRIEREIGRGGQATVHLAEDTHLGRQVALKVLSGIGADERMIHRFRHEAEAAARLDHPGICTVHDAGVDDGVPYIAMRYVEGETLAAKVAAASTQLAESESACGTTHGTSRSDVMRVVLLMEQAALAVHAAHEAGVVHRDLKPGNIMVTPEGDPVVLDFGLARDEEADVSMTLSGDLNGTPAYMAPEQIRPAGRADRRTDVYSLGATLYECLTLRRPFEAPTREGLYRAVLDQEVSSPRSLNPAIPADLAVVVQTAMAKEQDQRYQTAADLAEELRRVRELQPIRARPAGPITRTRRWARRNPTLAVCLTGVVLTMSVGVAVTSILLAQNRSSLAATIRLTDIRSLPQMNRAFEEEAWPAAPPGIPGMTGWLADVDGMLARADDHRACLGGLRDRASGRPGEGKPGWVFDDPDVQRAHDELAAYLDGLPDLSKKTEAIRVRLDEANTIVERTVERYRDEWAATIRSIELDPKYGGLYIEPQIGLVPLGQDPESRLHEFGHPQTGELPVRDPETGRLHLTEACGLVFVLIPGGTFRMGSERPMDERPEGSPNVDPYTTLYDNERPVHPVELEAFFISKYEMTVGQWLRATGDNPAASGQQSLLEPVVNLTWNTCSRVLSRLWLTFPTEAQWEYATRAGTTTVWWTGNDPGSLEGAGNVADQSYVEARGLSWFHVVDFDDGYASFSPVKSFRANPFGLHDVIGNVAEFVRDWYGPYTLPVAEGDGERLVPDGKFRMSRDKYCALRYTGTRSAARFPDNPPDQPVTGTGVRPARPVRRGDLP